MKITEKEAYEERIQHLLLMKEANYRAYETLDKQIHEFSEWLGTRLYSHQQKGNIFATQECWSIQQKFDEVFFSVEAIATNQKIGESK